MTDPELRPLTGLGFSCDWGDCDVPAIFERHDPEHGWLPVCLAHTGKTARITVEIDIPSIDFGDAYAPRVCPVCGQHANRCSPVTCPAWSQVGRYDREAGAWLPVDADGHVPDGRHQTEVQ